MEDGQHKYGIFASIVAKKYQLMILSCNKNHGITIFI